MAAETACRVLAWASRNLAPATKRLGRLSQGMQKLGGPEATRTPDLRLRSKGEAWQSKHFQSLSPPLPAIARASRERLPSSCLLGSRWHVAVKRLR